MLWNVHKNAPQVFCSLILLPTRSPSIWSLGQILWKNMTWHVNTSCKQQEHLKLQIDAHFEMISRINKLPMDLVTTSE